jgi:hypothetical protein
MVNTYSDIAARPGIAGYPLVNQQTSGGATSDAQGDAKDAANFQRILDKLSAQAAQKANSASASAASTPATGSGSFKSFMKGLWDVVNPLQHIPVVGAIYRHVTGDTISPGAHFIGDALYGGPIGGAIAAADIAYQKTTGKDMGETVIASLTGGHKTQGAPTAPDTMVAQNLTQITPAAGSTLAPAGKNIIWSDNNNSKNIIWTSGSPLFPPSGTIGVGPASPSAPAQPVLQANSTASTSAVQTQEAPAGPARKSVPPELIASRMMEGLQKYAMLQQQNLNPQLSGLY